MFDVMFIYVN